MPESARSHELPVSYERPGGSGGRSKLLTLAAGLSALASVVLLGLYFTRVREAGRTDPPVTTAPALTPRQATDSLEQPLLAAVNRFLDAPMTLRFDGHEIQTTWRALGVVADAAAITHDSQRLSEAGT